MTGSRNPLQILSDLAESPAHPGLRDMDFFSRDVLIHSPLLLPDMEKAVEILLGHMDQQRPGGSANVNQEQILIAGDRDVDGVTSTVLLTDYLRRSTTKSVRYVNSSEGDDYGLTGRFLERLHDSPAKLVILLDMGSAHLEQALELVQAGKDVIILDHHIPQIPEGIGDRLQGIAFVNPRNYEHVEDLGHQGKIATAGLAFKLIVACEMRATDLWTRLLRIDLPDGESVLFRSGAFVAKDSTTRVDELLQGADLSSLRLFRTAVEGLAGFCSVFQSRSLETWVRMLCTSPVEFGRYLFACSLLHRPALLKTVVQECDLASIGLVADLVPLVNENRRMVALGLGRDRMHFARELQLKVESLIRPGLLALFYESGLDPFDLRTRDINFTVNPLINAAGRLGQTEKALELLLCRDPTEARLLASGLRRLNTIRKERTEKNNRILKDHLDFQETDAVVFFYHPELEPGISGLMATRLLESTGRPVVWINPDGEHARGSARSRAGWNMVELLQPLSEHLVQLGGHAEACGFTIAYDRIEDFRQALLLRAQEYGACADSAPVSREPAAVLKIPGRHLGPALMEELALLEPFGTENPEPILEVRGARILRPSVMKKGVHLRFAVSGTFSDVEFVYWNCPESIRLDVLDRHSIDSVSWKLTGYLEKNRIPGMKPIRFRLQFIEPDQTLSASGNASGKGGEDGLSGGADAQKGQGLFASGL